MDPEKHSDTTPHAQETQYGYFLSNIENLVKQNLSIREETEQLVISSFAFQLFTRLKATPYCIPLFSVFLKQRRTIEELVEQNESKDSQIQTLKEGREHFKTHTIKMVNELSDIGKSIQGFKTESNSHRLQLFAIEKQIDNAHNDSKKVQTVIKNENSNLQSELKNMILQKEQSEHKCLELQEQLLKSRAKCGPLLQEKGTSLFFHFGLYSLV